MTTCNYKTCTQPTVNSGKCKEHYNLYMKNYMKQRYYKRREKYIAKLGGACVDCGTEKDLEFDHLDSSKKSFDVGKAFAGWSESRIEAELEKCVLRCKNHHLEKSKNEDFGSVEHGEGLTGKRNCRCDLCRPLKNRYSAEFKKKKKHKIE